MKTSCGALLYTYNPAGSIGIILGCENGLWLPFKGCTEDNETYEQTAIREVEEETCGVVKLNSINLEHKFASKRKQYYIGLSLVDYGVIDRFNESIKNESRASHCEKKELQFFDLKSVLSDTRIHNITKASIKYYWNKLNSGSHCAFDTPGRKQSVSIQFAKRMVSLNGVIPVHFSYTSNWFNQKRVRLSRVCA